MVTTSTFFCVSLQSTAHSCSWRRSAAIAPSPAIEISAGSQSSLDPIADYARRRDVWKYPGKTIILTEPFPSRDPLHRDMPRDVRYHNGSRRNNRPLPNAMPWRDCCTDTNQRSLPNLDAAGKMYPGSNVRECADLAIVIDCRSSVDDSVITEDNIRIDDCACGNGHPSPHLD
jgi:hypothetical protein